MIIDDHLDPREHAKISEIYFYLHARHPEPNYIEERSFEIMDDQDLSDTSEVSRVIAESIKKGNLTGTGSALYAIFNSFEEASKIIDNAPKNNNYFVTRSLNESPLLKELNKNGV